MLEKLLSMLEVTVEMGGKNIIFSLVFIVIGFALIVWAIINIISRSKKKKTFTLIDGKVVNYAVSRNSDGPDSYGIIAEYIVDDVSYLINPTSYSGTTRAKHPIGSIVKVRYNPENPADAIFDKDGGSVLMLIVGIAFFIAGIIMF